MARSFNGSSDHILTASTFALPTAATFSCWINPGTLSNAYNGVMIHNTGGNAFFQMFLKSTGVMAWYCFASAQLNIDPGSASIASSAWTHVAQTYDSTNGLKTYVNTVSDGTVAANGNLAAGTPSLAIGYDNNNAGRNFPGKIADTAYWSVALTSGNITSLFNGVRPVNVNSGNLIGWWPLDGYASPETDLSSNANNGTLTGTAQVLGPPALWRISG